jgi:hypothetical protein
MATDEVDDSDATPTRRSLLALTAAAGSALAGCSWGTDPSPPTGTPTATRTATDTASQTATPTATDSATPTRTRPEARPDFADRYETVVNVVEAGADPTGKEPITRVLHDHVGDDTLLYFPDGRYAVDRQTFRGFENLALVAGEGADPVIVPSAPERDIGSYLLTFTEVHEFLFEGFRFDFRREGYGGRVEVISDGDFTVRDVRTVGAYPDEVTAFRFDVREAEATGLVERLVAADTRQTNPGVTGVYVGRQHSGELTFRDCRVEWFPDNGLYASAPGGAGGDIDVSGDGPVHVEGGRYRNNNVANVRLGSTGSTARGVTIVVDEVPPHEDDVVNARGLRLRGQRDQVVEDCDIRIGPEAGDGFGAVVVHHDNGPFTMRNSRIRVDRDEVPAINALRPALPQADGPTFENVRITGTASGGNTVTLIGRDVTTFQDCCIHQRGAGRNGIRFENSDGCIVVDSTIDVTGSPTLRQDSAVTVENVQYAGGCRVRSRWLPFPIPVPFW